MTYDDLMTTAGGVPLILADLRARALAGNERPIYAPGEYPARIGANFHLSDEGTFANKFAEASWQNVNNGYSFGPGPFDAPANSFYYLHINPPEDNGGWYNFKWREPGNQTNVSQWTLRFWNVDLNYSGTRMQDITITYADGIFNARFRYFAKTSQKNNGGLVWWKGSGSVQLIDFRAESVPTETRILPSKLAIIRLYNGVLRALDTGGGNVWNQQWTWATRARENSPAGYVSQQPSLPFESWISLWNEGRRDPWWIFTHMLSEETVKATAQAIMRGTGTDNGVGLSLDRVWYVEPCGNEPWHGGFTGTYESLRGIGFATGYAGSDENSARLYAQAKRSQLVAKWIREAVPEHMDRIVIVASLSPDNDLFDYEALLDYGFTDFQAVAQSVYLGLGVKNQHYGNDTPAELQAPWSADGTGWINKFLRNRPRYIADGKRHLAYEVGRDVINAVMGVEKATAWQNSPEADALYLRDWMRLAFENGDELPAYWDFGQLDQGGGWAHFNGIDQPNLKHNVLLEVQAQVNAALITD